MHAFENSIIDNYGSAIETTNYFNEKIYTNHSLNIFRRWIEKRNINKHITFINTSLKGLKINGSMSMEKNNIVKLSQKYKNLIYGFWNGGYYRNEETLYTNR